MEISDYLGLIRRRARLAALIPIASGILVVAALLLTSRPTYTTTATVSSATITSAPGTPFSGSQGSRLLLESIDAAAGSRTVSERVSQETGTELKELRSDGAVSVQPVGDSSLVQIVVRLPDADASAAVARSTAAETLSFLLAPQVGYAEATLKQSSDALDAVRQDLVAFSADPSQPPAADLDTWMRETSTLREQAVRLRAEGSTTAAARLEAVVAERTAQLPQLAPQLTRYSALLAEHDQAIARVNDAKQLREQALALVAAAEQGQVITVGQTFKDSLTPDLVRSAVGGVGAGVLLAVFLIVLLEFLRRPPTDYAQVEPKPKSSAADPIL